MSKVDPSRRRTETGRAAVAATRRWLAVLVAGASMALVPAGAIARTPEKDCQRATAKTLARCVSALGAAGARCYAKTGVACPASDPKRAAALEKLEAALVDSCPDAGAVEAAGYAPLTPAELAERLGGACAREIDGISLRSFGGSEGPLLAGAGKQDTRCLLAAGMSAGKLLAKTVQAVGRCAGRPCKLEKVAAKRATLEARTARRLERKCDDLEALVGLGPEAFAREAASRVVGATASPCDPLDPGHCLFPFSNDYFSVLDSASPTGRRLRFASEGMPSNADGVPIDPSKWEVLDGFSVGPMLLVHDPALDLAQTGAAPITEIEASLEAAAPVLLLDAESGARQLLWVERDSNAPSAAEQTVIARVATNLENGRRYLAAIRGARDAAGDPIAADPVFAAYRDGTPTALLPVEARRGEMEALFESLSGFGVARSDLYLAWAFTTQSIESTASKLLAMRDDAFDNVLGTSAPAFTVDAVIEPFDAAIFRRIDGTFQAPLYLTDGGVPGSGLRLGPDGLPENQGDSFTASYRCVVPYAATTAGAAPAVPARPALYGHGLLGSASEAGASHVRAFASEQNFVICGTDWTGFAEEDLLTVFDVLQDFSDFPLFIERQHQGVLNFMVLGRLLQHAQGFASDPAFQVGGESVIDPNGLFYDGNSQGGILGGTLAAVSRDIERFVLGVPGMNYSTLLNRSVDFIPFGQLLQHSYPNGLDQIALIAVAQILWDQTDPSGHARHTTSDPYPGTPAKKLLYQVAFGDHQVSPFTVEIAARSNGAHIHTPVLGPGVVVPETTPYYGIPPIPAYPFDGSAVVIWDSGNPAPPIENRPPEVIEPNAPGWSGLTECARRFDSDPHECPRRQPSARMQKSEFLRNDGAVVDVCGGMPCVAPDS